MRLWKISYVSVAAPGDEAASENAMVICAFAEQHNARYDVTGILTLHGGRYAQVLEGPESTLRALMSRIEADTRHHSVRIISDGPLAKRRYASWSMAFRDPREFVLDQLEGVMEQTAAVASIVRGTRH